MKKYAIREVFGTLQGEGAQAGTPAVFLRFAGCNLGYEVCPWCDTDWVKARHTLPLSETLDLVRVRAHEAFGGEREGMLLVATGGEPSLQLDEALSAGLRKRGYRIAMESNGSRPIDRSLVDWLTISPKQSRYVQKEGDELKIVYSGGAAPGPAEDTEAVLKLAEGTRFDHHFLQPLDLPETGPNYEETVAAVMRLGPPWRVSVQTHKVLEIP
ncbi:MAG: 7-carboxy-7-deazaguanine synthase QueE [Gemmatimonadota bacterium]